MTSPNSSMEKKNTNFILLHKHPIDHSEFRDTMSGLPDRRRNNGPAGGTRPPLVTSIAKAADSAHQRPVRLRKPDELRKICKMLSLRSSSCHTESSPHIDLKTGVTPPASGSAYLELEAPPRSKLDQQLITPSSSAIKLSCVVHGPKPLPRSAAYSPHLALTCFVKFAPFSTRHRRGYLRDSSEKDLSTQLEMALRGVIMGERYPKTGADVCITILEGEEDRWFGDEPEGGSSSVGGWGLLNVLASCVTVACAALVDAGIDCIDLISGGTAAILAETVETMDQESRIVLDPNPTEHDSLVAACVVGYIASRDEMTLLWLRGATDSDSSEKLIDAAVSAATATRFVLEDCLRETAAAKFLDSKIGG